MDMIQEAKRTERRGRWRGRKEVRVERRSKMSRKGEKRRAEREIIYRRRDHSTLLQL